MAEYTDKVDALLEHATSLGFTEQDFAELAIAAADQSGCDADDQHRIELILGLSLEECADCGGSTAEGTPDPHVCLPLAASRCAYETSPCGDPRCARCGTTAPRASEAK